MIQLFEDRETLARAAAALFAEQAQRSVAAHDRFAVLLAGGETPRRTYQLLMQLPYRSRVPWGKVHLFWGDERCVPPDDPRSNQFMVRSALLDGLPQQPELVHPICGDLPPQRAADDYQAELIRYFDGEAPRFDLALLGLGADGHTASLLPGSAALSEQVRWTAVTRRLEEAFSRVTLTVPIINQSAIVLFLVTGPDKAAVLGNILNGSTVTPPYPAQLIQPLSGDLRWFVDQEAASYIAAEIMKKETGHAAPAAVSSAGSDG